MTINHNWRTALHKDAGDLKEGFGNLVVLEEGKYKGGETGFPQYGVCVDVRQGDFLAMDVHEWHCNTKLLYGGEHDTSQEDEFYESVTYMGCPECGTHVEIYKAKKNLDSYEAKSNAIH